MIRHVLLFSFFASVFTTAVLAQSCLPGASWCSGAYSYDAAGNIRAIGNDVYIYDTAGRLISGTADVQRTGVMSRQDYSYDAFGNRIAVSRVVNSVDCAGACELPVTIDANTNHINNSGAQYDAAGNLTFIQNTVGSTTYTATYSYDTAGRLARATANSDDRQFLYTADDERIATANGASWTWTVRGLDGKVLREFTSMPDVNTELPTANTQWSKDYVWRDGLLLASVTPTAAGASTTRTQHFHLDHLGTPRLVTGDNGVTLGIHAYYPFGAELNLGLNEQPNELMKFTGHERDVLAGDPHTLDDMHARYYSPTVGRFLSADPVLDTKVAMTNPQGWNRYAYVRNNPMRWTDPTGKVIGYDDEFRKRVKNDAVFRQAFEAWKKTKSGNEQWTKMSKDTNTVYKFSVGRIDAPTGFMKTEQANGRTLPIVFAQNENKRGKLDQPNVNMTINADFVESSYRNVQSMTSPAIARALFEEASHGLDIGSGTKSAKEAWDAEPMFNSGTEPRMQQFERELKDILPPPDGN